MKIVFDLDEVVFDWINDFLRYIDKYWDQLELENDQVDPAIRKATSADADSWEFFAKWGLNRSLFEKTYNKYCDDRQFASCPPTSPDIAVDIGWLSECGIEIVYCTSRPLKTILDTRASLDSNGIHWDKIYHCGAYLSKMNSVLRLTKEKPNLEYIDGISQKKDVFLIEKPDIVLDDKLEYILEAYNAGVPDSIVVAMKYNKEWREKNSVRGLGRKSAKTGFSFTNSNKWRSVFYEILKVKNKMTKVKV
jgi:hypothetical protein